MTDKKENYQTFISLDTTQSEESVVENMGTGQSIEQEMREMEQPLDLKDSKVHQKLSQNRPQEEEVEELDKEYEKAEQYEVDSDKQETTASQ